MATLTMPQLGESVTEGTIIKWLKQPGDAVALDEPLVEVETEKVDIEIPSPYAGTLGALLVPEGETVPVGTPLAEIDGAAPPVRPELVEGRTDSLAAPPASVRPDPSFPPGKEPVEEPVLSLPKERTTPETRPGRRFSPAVARLAAEHGIDPATLTGSGAAGRVTRKDVLAAVEGRAAVQPPPVRPELVEGRAGAPEADTVVAFTPTRRRIAQHMLESVRSAPHAWLLMEADVTELVRLRQRHKDDFRRRQGADLSYLAFAAQAAAQALRDFPILNATWAGDDLVQRGAVNLGLAVDTEAGLLVPVIKDAHRLNVAALAVAIAELAERARRKRLKLDDVQGGTFTIDNTGVFGVIASAPIINSPQVAILTTEAIVKRPRVLAHDAIAVRSMMNLCLSFDHRAMDGATAAAFVARVRDVLEAVGPDTPIS